MAASSAWKPGSLAIERPGRLVMPKAVSLAWPSGRASAKSLRVGRVGAGIARLDIVDPERIELLGDQPFVLDREIDAVGLRAVAQRRVVEREPFAGHRATSQVVTSSPVFGSLASFSVMPMASSSSRMRSASLKFFALRAALRASISASPDRLRRDRSSHALAGSRRGSDDVRPVAGEAEKAEARRAKRPNARRCEACAAR